MNAKREGVSKTRSGLQYEILAEGSTSTEKVRGKHTIELHYHGTLWDGTVFDSSIERGQAINVRLWDVIPGWSEGLKLMSPGDKYRFYIPSRLAYGSEGTKTVPPLLSFNLRDRGAFPIPEKAIDWLAITDCFAIHNK